MSLLEDTFILPPQPPDVIPPFVSGTVVEVFFPEQPFGGVQVEGVVDVPIQLEINTGSPVFSVFGRTGNITPQPGDYAAFYAPAGQTAPVASVFGRLGAVIAAQTDYVAFYALKNAGVPVGGAIHQVLSKKSNLSLDTEWVSLPGLFDGKFTSLDFTGSNLTSILTRNFADLQSKPTTLAGYGITDAQPLDADLTSIAALVTTPFGRGGLTQADAPSFRSYIGAGTSSFDGAFASLTGKPTTLGGYGITDAQPLDSDLTAIAALATTSFGRGALTQTDAAAFRAYIGAGGVVGGTVTSFSAGDLAPLFTTAETNPSTTPDLQFALSNVSQNQFLGRTAAGSGQPSYLQIPFTALSGAATTSQGGIPTGGTTGQVLIKNSSANYDVSWADVVTPT